MFTKLLEAPRIAIEKRRQALQGLPWLRRLLRIIYVLSLLELFLPYPFWIRVFLWLATVIGNYIFTPKLFKRAFEGTLSFSGDLRLRHFRPLPLDPDVLAKHRQLSVYSCIPMAVEFVLPHPTQEPNGQ